MVIRAQEIIPARLVHGFGTQSKKLLRLNFFRQASQNVRDTKRYSQVIRQKTSKRMIAVAVVSGKDRLGNLQCAPMDPPKVYIEQLAVVPRLQCQGLGSILLNFLMDRFSKSTIELHCYSNRHVQFQSKHGFSVQEEKWLAEDEVQQFFMTKLRSSCNGAPPNLLRECARSLDASLANELPLDSKDLPGLGRSRGMATILPQCVAM